MFGSPSKANLHYATSQVGTRVLKNSILLVSKMANDNESRYLTNLQGTNVQNSHLIELYKHFTIIHLLTTEVCRLLGVETTSVASCEVPVHALRKLAEMSDSIR